MLRHPRTADQRFDLGVLRADHGPDETPLRLTPLLRIEALYLLSQTSLGLVVCTTMGAQTRTLGFHAVLPGELIILTPVTPELEATLRDGRLLSYRAESVDEPTRSGWHATFTGPARIIAGPPPRRQHRTAASHFEAGLGTRMVRLRPQSIEGHRFQRLNAAS